MVKSEKWVLNYWINDGGKNDDTEMGGSRPLTLQRSEKFILYQFVYSIVTLFIWGASPLIMTHAMRYANPQTRNIMKYPDSMSPKAL